MQKNISKLIVYTIAIIFILSSCTTSNMEIYSMPNQDSYRRLNDIAPAKITEKNLDLTGEIDSVTYADFGYLITTSEDKDKKFISFYDNNNTFIWKSEVLRDNAVLLTKDLTVLLTDNGFTAFEYNGNEKWSYKGLSDSSDDMACNPDGNGGAYFLKKDIVDGRNTCIQYHISNTGELVDSTTYEDMPDLTPYKSYVTGEQNWLYGFSENSGQRYFLNLSDTLSVKKSFQIKKDEYPDIKFDGNKNRLFLFGQGYDDENNEYGFIYILDLNLNVIAYKTYPVVPFDILTLDNGNIIVSFYDRQNTIRNQVKILSSDLSEQQSISIAFSYARLFSDSNGIIITGYRLAPGQPYESMAISYIQAKLDTVIEKYSFDFELYSRKTYFAENNKDSTLHSQFVTKDGCLITY